VTLLSVLINIVLPVFLIIGAGYLAARWLRVDIQTLSRVSLYVLGPCLVFSKLVETTVSSANLAQIVAFTVAATILVLGLSWVVARLLRLDRPSESGFMLASTFVNSGNYGLPLVLFAFGQTGLERALVYFVTSAFLVNTLGVFVASRGTARATTSIVNIFKIPLIYAIAAAFALRVVGLALPDFVLAPTAMVGDAAIPVMLLLLGMQLARTSFAGRIGLISAATAVRLVGGAVVGVLIASLMGLSEITGQTCIIEHSTPTGVVTSILSMEFGSEPELVTGVIFASTLASIVTMTFLISWLS
jgi:predicted permease